MSEAGNIEQDNKWHKYGYEDGKLSVLNTLYGKIMHRVEYLKTFRDSVISLSTKEKTALRIEEMTRVIEMIEELK